MKIIDFKPVIDRPHPVGSGSQRIFRFPNGYGASVVRFTIGGLGFGSYTDGNEWELAVVKFKGKDNEDFELAYDTPITDDVIGHLSDDEVESTLKAISELPPKQSK